tara:strand:- start:583 stop:735 length:153 start_codon:yes stop_codon:yes gene_type:complete
MSKVNDEQMWYPDGPLISPTIKMLLDEAELQEVIKFMSKKQLFAYCGLKS